MKKTTKTMRRFICLIISTIVMMTATMLPVFAADSIEVPAEKTKSVVMEQATAADGLIGWIKGLNGTVKGIGLAVAGVAVLVLGIMLIGGGNGAMSKSKGVAIGICVGVAVLGFGPTIIDEIASATGSLLVIF